MNDLVPNAGSAITLPKANMNVGCIAECHEHDQPAREATMKETPASERLAVRMPVSLRLMLGDAAKACSLSLSAYVRDRLTAAAQRDLRRAAGGK